MVLKSQGIILIIPAYNESEVLPAVLRRIDEEDVDLQCVVVDDGSDDDTAGVARGHGATVIRHAFNLGYGAALQTGYKYALAEGAGFVVQMDADGQHDPREIRKLLEPVRQGTCDVMIGSRFLGSIGYEMGPVRHAGRWLFQSVGRLFGLSVTDPTSGFQAMNRAVIAHYTQDYFPSDYPDVDVLVGLQRHGGIIHECPVCMTSATRESRIHGGLRPVYYVYKMILSFWSAGAKESLKADRLENSIRKE